VNQCGRPWTRVGGGGHKQHVHFCRIGDTILTIKKFYRGEICKSSEMQYLHFVRFAHAIQPEFRGRGRGCLQNGQSWTWGEGQESQFIILHL